MSSIHTALLFVSLTTAARAQCPTWSDSLALGGLSGPARDFLVHDRGSGPRLVAAGDFLVEDGVLTRGVAEFDGQRWRGFPEQLDGDTNTLVEFDFGQGPQLVVGGHFQQSGSGTPMRGVARWTGSAWAPLGEGFS